LQVFIGFARITEKGLIRDNAEGLVYHEARVGVIVIETRTPCNDISGMRLMGETTTTPRRRRRRVKKKKAEEE
jgi:hypothetical protein